MLLKKHHLGSPLRWIAHKLKAKNNQLPPILCTLGQGSTLLSNSEINNFSGISENISIGENTSIRGRLLTYAHGGKISIGNWCYIGERSDIWSMESIFIGNRVLISHNVNIHDGTGHSKVPTERHQHFRHIVKKGHPVSALELPGVSSAAIIIEDDVWISFNVTILQGVRIGKGSVIAAGSIVTKDVPPGMIYRNQISPVMEPLISISKMNESRL